MGTWRPANIKGLPAEAAHVINQLMRETNMRIDDTNKRLPTHQQLKGQGVLNFGTIPANTAVERTINLLGIGSGAAVMANPVLNLGNANLIWSAHVPTSNQVTVRLLNPTSSPVTVNKIGRASCR